MKLHQVLLISRDSGLEARVRRALPQGIATELHCWPGLAPCPDPQGWLLVLWDELCALDPASGAAIPLHPGTPVIWLGDAARRPQPEPEDAEPLSRLPVICDVARRGEPISKLSFILHQHLTWAYLRRMRAPALVPSQPADVLQCRLNNVLTGILGNAELASELALDGGRRLPPPLTQRLRRIAELASEMRDLIEAFHPDNGFRMERGNAAPFS